MSEPKAYDPKLKAALEYGPLLAFMVGYWWFKDQSFVVGGQTYTGFIAVTAVFVLVFVASILALWRLTGQDQPDADCHAGCGAVHGRAVGLVQ